SLLFSLLSRPPSSSTRFPYTTLFRSTWRLAALGHLGHVALLGANEQLARTTDLLLGVGDHFIPLRDPAYGARHGENAGEQGNRRSEEHTSELQSRENLVCRLLLEKKK